MITFNSETDFELINSEKTYNWIQQIISNEGFELGELNYIFCDDQYLYKLNVEFLQHNTYTDIISFDYSLGKIINGDIYISIDRVRENAQQFGVTFNEELHRVLIHGVLHYFGFKDKTENEKKEMRSKENACLGFLND